MQLVTLDWAIIFGYFLLALGIGLWAARKAGESADQFFLSGRDMPWWLLGFSMVATTFSTDTPNLVTDIVRQHGVSGNWVWWAFLLTGMLTVFCYARLWRRSEVLTDVEFYELRYSGKSAAFLRGFRALYLGVFFNTVIMAAVSLAAIKLGHVMLGLSPVETILGASVVTVLFSTIGGFRSVVLTDAILFGLALIGSVAAAVAAVNHPQVGGITELMSHPNVAGKLRFVPEFDWSSEEKLNLFFTLFLMPLAVQWWSMWYPGSEPGGGGYQAQRMLAAKSEEDAVGATLFFNVAHYAIRPWPWILVGLASLVVYPDLASLQQAFPNIEPDLVKNDLAYPAMLTFLPAGWRGLVLASLIAAYMSTISTHLNWGSSYLVNDFYQRFVNPKASESQLVWVGRVSTVCMMVAAAFFALRLENALDAFQLILQIGAGTGLLFILRWFWWRINALSEVAALVASFLVAVGLEFTPHTLADWQQLLLGVTVTTVSWVLVTFLTPPTKEENLREFCRRTNPGGPGWKAFTGVESPHPNPDIGSGLVNMMMASAGVYAMLFGTGSLLYGRWFSGAGLLTFGVFCGWLLRSRWKAV
jgi:solute:Na+ symporter, SSS family